MPAILSTTVYTKVDQGGTPRTEVWTTVEFRESYAAGGIAFDFSPQFRRVNQMMFSYLSGSQFFTANSGVMNSSVPQVQARAEDFGTPASVRLQLFVLATSGLGGLEMTAAALSGQRYLAHVLGY